MLLQKIYSWSKKIHRLAMWLALIVGGGMMSSGMVMHWELEGKNLKLDTIALRELHNTMAVPFVVILSLMIATGLVMWGVPKILSLKAKTKLS